MNDLKIISGGQTGVDQGALDFALDQNLKCGGYCPKGRKSEKGTIPYRYPVTEIESEEYFERTKRNIVESDGTLILKDKIEIRNGVLDTVNLCKQLSKPYKIVNIDTSEQNKEVMNWIFELDIQILNIAGNRESVNPDIRRKVYLFLINLFKG
ncbi:MAG: hypothetical protein C0597_10360 [Marinilabiliales bacterium]|nr:MAG: hypothetical protein C0597_10360 [Marinilabiliales bacterium]